MIFYNNIFKINLFLIASFMGFSLAATESTEPQQVTDQQNQVIEKNQRFVIDTVNKGFFNITKKITYYYGDQEIGSIFYEQLPVSFFVLDTFFICQQYRNQGHGIALLTFACNELTKLGARKIIIQPGPFELRGNRFIDIPSSDERDRNLERLVRLYKKVGFLPAPPLISYCAGYLYKLMGICEDAHYLMLL